MTPEWAAAAAGALVGGVVQGLAGFAFGLVALSFLAFVLDPVQAVVVVTGLAFLFTLIGAVLLRRHVEPRALALLLIGTAVGTPLGVGLLSVLSGPVLRRAIGALLIGVVLLELGAVRGPWTAHPVAALVAGVLSGVLGGAVHAAGPPVVLYAAGRGWTGRTAKANLQAFFTVNQALLLAGYAWTGLLTATIARTTLLLALPAFAGFAVGWTLFHRVGETRFRQILFGLLFVSGAALLVRG